MNSRRQRSIPVGGRYRHVSLYLQYYPLSHKIRRLKSRATWISIRLQNREYSGGACVPDSRRHGSMWPPQMEVTASAPYRYIITLWWTWWTFLPNNWCETAHTHSIWISLRQMVALSVSTCTCANNMHLRKCNEHTRHVSSWDYTKVKSTYIDGLVQERRNSSPSIFKLMSSRFHKYLSEHEMPRGTLWIL